MALQMSRLVSEALKLYLDQKPRRSLRQLVAMCAESDIKASLPTLKRWSTLYGWMRVCYEHDKSLAEQAASVTEEQRKGAAETIVAAIERALERYYWIIDPDNPSVSLAKRKRATDMRVTDFLKLLEVERHYVALLNTLERAPKAEAKQTYTEEEQTAMMRALAEVRHGLPRSSARKNNPGHAFD
jgi:hypothetical protein